MNIRHRLLGLLAGPSAPVGAAPPPSALPPAAPPLAAQSPAPKPSAEGLAGPKLNIGSGWDNRAGWVNIDMHASHNPDIVADATRLTPIEDNYAAYALAQDILEHIHRDRVMTALREWNRVLRPGGLLEIRTTDVIAIIDLMREPERANPEQHDTLLRCMFGTQAYAGDFHLSGFTEIWMRDALEKAGFDAIYVGRKDQWLLDVVGRKMRHCPPDPLIALESDEAFVEGAYRRVRGCGPDEEGRAYWLKQLASGIPREALLGALQATG